MTTPWNHWPPPSCRRLRCGEVILLDETGAARAWLTAGRGIAVWTSQEIGANRPDILTPGDHVCLSTCGGTDVVNDAPLCRKPHWAYMPECVIWHETDVMWYLPGAIVKSWSDGPAGYRAAHRWLDSHDDETLDAPIGRILTTYTLHRYAMVSAEISPDGVTVQTYGPPLAADPNAVEHRPLVDLEFRVGVRMWSAIDRNGDSE